MNFLRLLDALPIQQQDYVVRIFDVVKEVKADFAGALASDEVRIESFFPAVEIRNLVADQNVHHESASTFHSSHPRYEIRGRM